MHVILDTNILRQDILLRSDDFNILLDYLNKTNSKVIFPQIVYEEVKEVYKRLLVERENDFSRAFEKLENTLVDNVYIKKVKEVKVEQESEKYLGYLKDKLRIKDNEIIPYRDNYLSEIIQRAICRKKPCSEKGQEFRDTVLWLSILDITKQLTTREIVFISNNTRDFASKDNKCLHKDLQLDMKKNNLKIHYYNSLKHFIKTQAIKIDYINISWIKETIDIDEVNSKFVEYLNEHGDEKLLPWIKQQILNFTGYYSVLYSNLSIDSYYVYEMQDLSLRLEVMFIGEIEVEVEYEKNIEYFNPDYKYEYVPSLAGGKRAVSKLMGEFDIKSEVKCQCMNTNMEITISATVKNKKIEKLDITDWNVL
ncbi:MAG: DUF4935 domain-containing protein [Firmicutes bacterium]|nr:DUF4935 domain-containing protein [Bacillota bacterium]